MGAKFVYQDFSELATRLRIFSDLGRNAALAETLSSNLKTIIAALDIASDAGEMSAISLTSLTLVPDETLPITEMHLHPDLIEGVRRAFREADLLRSVHLSTRVRVVIHPFTSVGDEDDAA